VIDPPLPDRPEAQLSSRTLRQFAGLWLVVFAGLGSWQAYFRHRWTWALIFAGLAVVIGPLGLVKPRAIRPLFVAAKTVTHPVGWLITNLILICLFYLVFTPAGLFLKLMGKDVLDRGHSPGSNSYWAPKPRALDVRDYFRQS
jgi:hypothetical protein